MPSARPPNQWWRGRRRCAAAALVDELALLALRGVGELRQGQARLRILADVAEVAWKLDDAGTGWADVLERWRALDVDRAVAALLLTSREVLGWHRDRPALDDALDQARPRLGPAIEWLGLQALTPSGIGRRRSHAIGALVPGGSPARVLGDATARARQVAATAAGRALERGASTLRPRGTTWQIAHERRAVQTPLRPLQPPDRPGEVFVVLAAHRDPEAQATIEDLFAKAVHPERVSVGVVWQVDDEVDGDCRIDPVSAPGADPSGTVPARRSLGVCWARYEAQRLWRGEEHVLHIDSHSRFVPGWDDQLRAELAACPSPKPYLTGYPGGYRLGVPAQEAQVFDIEPWQFFEDGVLRLHARERRRATGCTGADAVRRRGLLVRSRRGAPGGPLRPVPRVQRGGDPVVGAAVHARLGRVLRPRRRAVPPVRRRQAA